MAFAGNRLPAGWAGPARAADWTDAVDAAQHVAATLGLRLRVGADDHAPWHPGRCARLELDGVVVGHAGELHPTVLTALGLPPRVSAPPSSTSTCCWRRPTGCARRQPVSTFPLAKEDLALVVDADVPAADVEAALRHGGGDLRRVRPAVRRLRRPAGGPGQEVAGVRAAVARSRPHPDGRRDGGGARRGCRRGRCPGRSGAARLAAPERLCMMMRFNRIVMRMTMRVAVAGASGYAGGEVLRLLLGHPASRGGSTHRRRQRRNDPGGAPPAPAPDRDQVLLATTTEALADHDVVVLALPHGASAEVAARLPDDVLVLDCGADHRLTDAGAWAGVLRAARTPGRGPTGCPS